MLIGFDRIAQVGCGHKPSSADADYFASKALLRVMICQVLDHRVGIDDIEAFVAKGERATIEDQRLHARKTTLVILHFGQRKFRLPQLVGDVRTGIQTVQQTRN